jgi:hypothetical protein
MVILRLKTVNHPLFEAIIHGNDWNYREASARPQQQGIRKMGC